MPKLSTQSVVWDLGLFLLACVHIISAPFNKIEESFNVEACHDLLFHQLDLDKYDHVTFDPVVPRTFIGPIVLTSIVSPMRVADIVFGLGLPKLWYLIAVRMALALLHVLAWRQFRLAFVSKFGDSQLMGVYFLLTISQFHIPFYLSRVLSNSYALVLVLLAYSYWLRDRPGPCTAYLAAATIIFRCDVFIVALPVLVMAILCNWRDLLSIIKYGLFWSAICIGLTIVVDSFFWRRWLWPEWEVVEFNILDNNMENSSMWGVEPYHWYFTSALPRSLFLSLPLSLLAVFRVRIGTHLFGLLRHKPLQLIQLDTKVLKYLVPMICFVVIYSYLPHKELRFLFPALPMFTAMASVALVKIWNAKSKDPITFVLSCIGIIVALGLTCVFLYISSLNYPAGYAMQQLNTIHVPDTSRPDLPLVYIDNPSAISGYSRFGEDTNLFRYTREDLEELSISELVAVAEKNAYDYIISAREQIPGYDVIDITEGVQRVSYRQMKVDLGPVIYVYQRQSPA